MKENLIVLLLSIPILANISSTDIFYFNDSNAFGEWTGGITPGYGSVEITQFNDNRLDFVVNANEAYFTADPGEPCLTWDNFLFNIDGLTSINTSNITISEPGSWAISEKNLGPYKTFEFLLKGTRIGDNYVNPLEFSINLDNITIADVSITNSYGWMFAGHLKRFEGMEGVTSTWLAVGDAPNPGPEPATMILFGTGLVGLAGVARRKKKQYFINPE